MRQRCQPAHGKLRRLAARRCVPRMPVSSAAYFAVFLAAPETGDAPVLRPLQLLVPHVRYRLALQHHFAWCAHAHTIAGLPC